MDSRDLVTICLLRKGHARISHFITSKLALLPLTLGERHFFRNRKQGGKDEGRNSEILESRLRNRRGPVLVSSLHTGVGEVTVT